MMIGPRVQLEIVDCILALLLAQKYKHKLEAQAFGKTTIVRDKDSVNSGLSLCALAERSMARS
jgi:hypothetical protein